MEDGNSVTTRLLTLLNVSAVKIGKRKPNYDELSSPTQKLNKRRVVMVEASEMSDAVSVSTENIVETDNKEDIDDEGDIEDGPSNGYEQHFGVDPIVLSETSREAVDKKAWTTIQESHSRLGQRFISIPEGLESIKYNKISISDRLLSPFRSRQARQLPEQSELQNNILSALSSYRDLYVPSLPPESSKYVREVLALHVLHHVTRKRRKILKNNERLSHAAKTTPNSPPEDVQDQGFTRPSVLVLLPFRSSARRWLDGLTSHTRPPAFQIENHSRFVTEYGLPPGAVDKLASAAPGTYPPDHIETFQGNVDDNFRLGVKLTRKSVKLFAEFYNCDIIVASPLGLRMSIEKEKSADFLSSIEILVVDQTNTLVMQNWEHVQFIFTNLNKLPKDSHDADFSRIKPWYLDGHASYLRQTVLLSPFETSETRALFNHSLHNVAGKMRSYRQWQASKVPEGVEQTFIKFDCPSPEDEADKRFNHFTTQVLPLILKSAVQSANTAIFIPSSFDFIRVHNHFRGLSGVSFTVLSEYSSNQDISRARQAFFTGKKSFVLVSERFHFYRRYKIRGIRNLVFYGLPEHPQFYTEFLSYPFLDDGVVGPDITCRALYSKYDWFRLERIAGTQAAHSMIRG